MANVSMSGVEIYLDVRTKALWDAVTKVIPKGFPCVEYTPASGSDPAKAKLKIGDGVAQYPNLPYVGGDIDLSQVDTEIEQYLADYYTKTETDSAITTAISTALASVWVLKGRVNTVNDLPSSGNKVGDVYMVGLETDLNKPEYYWTGTAWEFFGQTVDLSAYYTKTQVDSLLGDKVDKVTGKGLSTEDYTTAEKTKLAGLSNYDDTALKARVKTIEDDYIKSTDKLLLSVELT